MTWTPLLPPRDGDALLVELRHLATEGRLPVVFGGEVHRNALILTQFIGTRTGLLRGLVVQPRSGLGGASMVAGRPLSVTDYRTASTITHDYDIPVLTEGIKSIVAVPVLVDGKPRAVLYAGERSGAPIGGRAAELVVNSARRLGHELRIRDEVDRRLRAQSVQLDNSRELAAAAEQVREVHAELRRLAADPAKVTGAQLRMLAGLLSEALSGKGSETAATLTSRELDVLAQVALGRTNREAAQRLSLRTETVKSYLRSAAAKLGARTRHEAVIKARRARLLP
ncbi:response regulator transcription factor [Mycobacterium palustre]|uniref:Helix-turn-helix transcriptional regulator n=1 Tax=Mycobacterium palustre TaxID=153971 RepID=A0A1X1ZXY7_9MYCO|nr:helix-turn-helix transcriptional regulator [Mycobacterium palustre]MCV7101241.1 helix-turn-helix transcriptional regulator [Mycobacterium palustre]ORW28889.1 helix-turn-helix transcriptional regulator [Mycobacterium palustre]